MVPLTKDLLIDAGGWQAMKEARALHAAGRVSDAVYAPPLLSGRVGELRSGLRIQSRMEIENLCSCPESRRRGLICAHSIAVGLEVLQPSARPAQRPEQAPAAIQKLPRLLAMDASGPEVQLHLIFPSSLRNAWDKGSITVAIECAVNGQRKSFGAFNTSKRLRCDDADARFAAWFLPLVDHKPASMAALTREQFAEMLRTLAGHPRLSLGKSRSLHVSEEGLLPPLLLQVLPGGDLKLECRLPSPDSLLRSKAGVWQFSDGVFTPVAPGLPAAYQSVLTAPVVIPNAAVAPFIERELPALASFFTLEGEEALPILQSAPISPPPAKPALRIEGSLNFLAAQFTAPIPPSATATLEAAGFSGPDRNGEWTLKGESRVLAFFAAVLPRLQSDWQVEIGERFQHVTRHVDRVKPRLEAKGSGEQWFDLSCEFETGSGERFSHAEIHQLLQSGQSHVKRKDRMIVFDPALLDDFNGMLRDAAPEQRSPGVFRLQRRQAGAIEAFASDLGAKVSGSVDWREGKPAQPLPPVGWGSLESTLRSYQKEGASWMRLLAHNGFGGVLADEMGLGKTLQTLAFLRTVLGSGPSLVVCPSSLLFNWEAEAARWTPDLKVLTLEGPRRLERFADIPGADLVLTSYPLLRLDIEALRQVAFTAAFLDEAQHIKNPDSQVAQSARALRARHRFVLTGTPVENSVRDLWSLMEFALPGYLGSRKEFQERYEHPIGVNPGGPEQQRLSRRLRPFLLRRTKQQAAPELPQKLEQVAWCELTSPQRALYDQLAQSTRRQLSELAGEKDRAKSRMVMLTALLRLRQAACDLRLLGMENPPPAEEASAKIELLAELLDEAREGGHATLVFSQFVAMLGMIRKRLDADGVEYCYLDGQSRDRAAQVQRFQSGGAPVFLISLKAGGTGLNLTAADTVIHFDPWWNPAVEAQATDRAHRIGQRKVVTSYKLIARNTVEEKILALQHTKKTVIAATLESEQPMMESLSAEELAELLR